MQVNIWVGGLRDNPLKYVAYLPSIHPPIQQLKLEAHTLLV